MNKYQQADGHEALLKRLRAQIDAGELAVGAMLPSENTLAEAYGLSRHRVREALGVLEETGYVTRSQGRRATVVHASARLHQLADGGQGRVLALSLPDGVFRYLMDLLHGFMQEAARQDCQVVAYRLSMTPEREAEFLRTLRASEIGGLALCPTCLSLESADQLRALAARGFPLVQIDRYIEDLDADSVTSDNELMGYALGRALSERGHTRIAYVSYGGVSRISSETARYEGFRRAMEEANLPVDETYTVALRSMPDSEETFRGALRNALAMRDRPTALQCVNHVVAEMVLRHLDELHYRVPEDMDIGLVDDNGFAEAHGLPLAVAKQNGLEIGKETAQLLIGRIEEPRRPREHRTVAPAAIPMEVGEAVS